MVDLNQYNMREERYLQIIRNCKLPDQSMLKKYFAKIYAQLNSVIYDDEKFNDNLGELFMRCNLGNKNTGQFFTPYHISEFMARATMEESLIKEKAEKDDILTISDPCCGGGGLLIAALDVLKSLGVNYARNFHCPRVIVKRASGLRLVAEFIQNSFSVFFEFLIRCPFDCYSGNDRR